MRGPARAATVGVTTALPRDHRPPAAGLPGLVADDAGRPAPAPIRRTTQLPGQANRLHLGIRLRQRVQTGIRHRPRKIPDHAAADPPDTAWATIATASTRGNGPLTADSWLAGRFFSVPWCQPLFRDGQGRGAGGASRIAVRPGPAASSWRAWLPDLGTRSSGQEQELAAGVPGLADLERGFPFIQGKGGRDRDREHPVGGELPELR